MGDPAMTPVSPYHATNATGGRIYARPKWMGIANENGTKLVPITDALTVEYDAESGSWTIRCVDGRWIKLEFCECCRQAVIDATRDVLTSPLGFGPLLDLLAAPSSIQVKVTCSDGIQRDGHSWVFDNDSQAGLHLHQWLGRFGEPVEDQQSPASIREETEEGGAGPLEEPAGDVIVFDLTAHKDDLAQRYAASQQRYATGNAKLPPMDRPVNLDPSIMPGTAGSCYRWYLDGRCRAGGQDTWAAVRGAASDATNAMTVTTDWLPGDGCKAWPLRVKEYGTVAQIARMTAAFDTSVIEGNVASCTLKLKKESGNKEDIAIRAGIVLDDTDNATYGNAASTGVDLGKASFDAATGVFSSGEMVGHGFSKNPEFAISVLEYDHDYLNVRPGGRNAANQMYLDVTPENGPYLEYTIASPSTSHRSLMGVGR